MANQKPGPRIVQGEYVVEGLQVIGLYMVYIRGSPGGWSSRDDHSCGWRTLTNMSGGH